MNHLGTITLQTKRLVLRQINFSDAQELFDGLRNQEQFLYYAHKQKVTYNEHLESLKDIHKKYENPEYYNWVITQKTDGKIVGMINLKPNHYNDSVEFNYATDNRYWGNGYMTETLKRIIDFALKELKVNRIQGGCVVENKASKRVMEKCNMHYEGILKKYIKLQDGYHDMFMFSLTN